jgi:hypothetical protein
MAGEDFHGHPRFLAECYIGSNIIFRDGGDFLGLIDFLRGDSKTLQAQDRLKVYQ